MLRFSLTMIIALAVSMSVVAQTQEKALAKADKLLSKNKVDQAEEYLEEYLSENPDAGEAWDLLVNIKHYHYQRANDSDIFGNNFTVSVEGDSSGEGDSLANMLVSLLNGTSLKSMAYDDMISTAKRATLNCQDAQTSAIFLRNFLFDVNVDTNVTDSAWAHYNRAEIEFQNRNYNSAANYYKKALEIEPKFYKASLYLGDSYFALGDYVLAAEKFKLAIDKFPDFVEPRKYLIDSYLKNGNFDEALEQAVDAMTVYPSLDMRTLVSYAAYENGLYEDFYWTRRGMLPHTYEKSKFTKTSDVTGKDNEPWNYYYEAKDLIKDRVNADGIITDAEEGDVKYAEVFAWEHMLANSDHPTLQQAREMKESGFLDCYVFVTCFHENLMPQFKHFSHANEDRIKDYFTAYLTAN